VKIENETPWDTRDLTEFFSAHLPTTNSNTIKVETLRASPGTKREDQPLILVMYGTKITRVRIISPKRVAQRIDTLDRLAVAGEVAAHEIALPKVILERIAHALSLQINRQPSGDWVDWECRRGECECDKALDHYPLIRGDLKERTARVIPIAELQRKMRWMIQSAESHEQKAEQMRARAARIQARILKQQAGEQRSSMSLTRKSI
jgi:hypothetical protein